MADPNVPLPEPFSAPPAAGPTSPGGAWETPAEPVGPAPGYRFAGHLGRFVAYIVDGFIVGLVIAAFSIVGLAIFFAGTTGDWNEPESLEFSGIAIAAVAVISIVGLVLSLGYFPWFWHRSGQTPGMKLFRLRVVRDRDGGPIGGGQAIVRLFGLWLGAQVLYLGYIWVFIDSRRRGWHDLIAGTVVIEEA
jgi:uncharacterized RDD family membrane protein YckC